jgi:hypothetical protein
MYDIVFLSYHEPNADEHWHLLSDRFPRAIRVSDVDGIVAAHQAAAKRCRTRYFWVVDADNIVSSTFEFNHRIYPEDHHKNLVTVWRAENNLNGLSYGYGGIKLLPRRAVLKVPNDVTDFTTSISEHFRIMDEVASVTVINSSPFDAWRSGFRECVKLSSGLIRGNKSDETLSRLVQWQENALDVPNREYVLMGAEAGADYGSVFANDPLALGMINDWGWLKNRFAKTMERTDDGSESYTSGS